MTDRTCSVAGCARKHSARGWCNLHYQRWLTKGDPLAEVRERIPGDLCAYEGCESPRYTGRQWCNKHYFQLYRNGEMGLAKGPTPHRNPDGVCGMEDCRKPASGRWCAMHATRALRHGDPRVVLERPKLLGPANPGWMGDDIGYGAAHDRVRRRNGRATDYGCAHGCGRQARDWAYDHKDPNELVSETHGCAYSSDPDHYIPLCVSCHRKFDGSAANLRPTAASG